MTQISAQELKRRGIAAIKQAVGKSHEAVITVQGRDRYVVLSMPAYNKLREYELELALAESQRDLNTGAFVEESIDKHMKRISR